TGLLCYAGHVCTYFQKSFEWFQELPARIGNHRWFMIKRRRSINASASETSQKKPTTANRGRLEAAFGELFQFMPHVYESSRVDHAHLAEYPLDREQEMLEPVEPDADLTGEVSVTQDLFCAWLRIGARGTACTCAVAVMRYAKDVQGSDLRGAVGPDTAWELCCRTLSLPPETKAMGSRTLAQLLMYWLDTAQVPLDIFDAVYAGMYEDLLARGKEIQAEGDETTMKCRWVKQQLHGEFDVVREVWLTEQAEAPVDLDIHGSVDEADHASIIREAEEAAGKLLEGLD
ncbi:MAG: hypothetical protein GY701_29185, partial [Sulfitobacter sp.]|nr:hypothetical protein [Sulfitobacter sp.]